MIKHIILLMALSPLAMATGGGKPEPKGNEQHQGQAQHQSAQSSSKAKASAKANTRVTNAVDNRIHVGDIGLDVKQGGARSSSESTGGSATASGGVASSTGDINIRGDDEAVAQAAVVFAGQCQNGLSGSLEDGGFSIVNTRQFCDLVELANVNWQAYQREIKCEEQPPCKTCQRPTMLSPSGPPPPPHMMQKPICEGKCTDKESWVRYNPPAKNCAATERGQVYLARYHDNLDDLYSLVETTQATGWLNRVASQLGLPVALIAVLFII